MLAARLFLPAVSLHAGDNASSADAGGYNHFEPNPLKHGVWASKDFAFAMVLFRSVAENVPRLRREKETLVCPGVLHILMNLMSLAWSRLVPPSCMGRSLSGGPAAANHVAHPSRPTVAPRTPRCSYSKRRQTWMELTGPSSPAKARIDFVYAVIGS
mgnify:CR=1 FL=1